MKALYLTILGCLLAFAGEDSLAISSHHPEDHFSHLPIGGRRALHGMVLFGSGPYFLEHIPMLTPPHDFQIITEVTLKDKNGAVVKSDFSHQGFTLKPSSTFSLNDYVAGRLTHFTASIHRGSFEQGGQVVPGLESVRVEIQSYKIIRQLPGQSQKKWILLNDGKNLFESNAIRPHHNVQLIRNASTGEILWCVKAPDFFESCY